MRSLKDLSRFSAVFSGVLMIVALLTTTNAFAFPGVALNQNTGQTYTDLNLAIVAANPGNTIRIDGTFVGNFSINKSLTLIGGEDAVLDGNHSGTTLYVGNVISNLVEVINIKIQNGNGINGGGIANSASLTLRHVELVDNFASTHGGGIFNDTDSSLTAINSLIHQNSATQRGGGIYTINGDLGVEGSEISDNSADNGAGIYVDHLMGYSGVIDSIISNNVAQSDGGGIYADVNSSFELIDVEISGNEARDGAGIFKDGVGTAYIDNAYIYENFASREGGGLYNFSGSTNFNFSKIAHNEAEEDGGGILTSAGAYLHLAVTEVEHNSPNNFGYN